MNAQALQEQEKKDQRKAIVVSIATHLLLLVLFYFLLAWKPQIPPPPEYGIELNFGISNVGSGDVQSKATPNTSENTEDSAPAPEQTEIAEEPQPEPQQTEAAPVTEQKVVTTPEPSPVAVKEEPKPKPEPKKEEVKEPEKPKAVYPGKSPNQSAGTGVSGSSNKPTGNSQGDDTDKVGDKGDESGTVDAKNLYGKPGEGSGGQLSMPGWKANIKAPKENSQEFGRIVFEIKVNDDGEVVNLRTIESTVSATVKNLYENEVYKASYMRSGPKPPNAPEYTTGRVTFILK